MPMVFSLQYVLHRPARDRLGGHYLADIRSISSVTIITELLQSLSALLQLITQLRVERKLLGSGVIIR